MSTCWHVHIKNMGDHARTISTALIVLVCFENNVRLLLDRDSTALFLSVTLGTSRGMSMACVLIIHVFQILASFAILIPVPSSNSKLSKGGGFGVMLAMMLLELSLALVSNDAPTSKKCALLGLACAFRLLDVLSSTEQRVYSGFVGQIDDSFVVDRIVGTLRGAATRYKANALTKLVTILVLLYAIGDHRLMFFPRTTLRRQLARSAWTTLLSFLSLSYSICVFDRTHVTNRKKSY